MVAAAQCRELLSRRGYSPKVVRLVRRFFNGRVAPSRAQSSISASGAPTSIGGALRCSGSWGVTSFAASGGRCSAASRSSLRAVTSSPAGASWIASVRSGLRRWYRRPRGFLFPPEHQAQFAAGIPDTPAGDHRAGRPQPAFRRDRGGHGGGGTFLAAPAAPRRRRSARVPYHLGRLRRCPMAPALANGVASAPSTRAGWCEGREILNRHPAIGLAIGVIREGCLEFFRGHGVADVESARRSRGDRVSHRLCHQALHRGGGHAAVGARARRSRRPGERDLGAYRLRPAVPGSAR